MDKIVSLCKRRGFIFQTAEIYGGMQGVYDMDHSALNLPTISRELGGNL